jgi:hypothetical protein
MDGADSVGSIALFLPLMSYGVMTSGLMYKGIYVDVLELLVFVFYFCIFDFMLCFLVNGQTQSWSMHGAA